MVETQHPPDAPPGTPGAGGGRADFMDWLRSGRLTLVDAHRQVVGPERWPELSEADRSRALAEFRRVVRGNAKAAVIFLKDR